MYALHEIDYMASPLRGQAGRSAAQRFGKKIKRLGFWPTQHFLERFQQRLSSSGVRLDAREFARQFFGAAHYRQTRPGYNTRIAVVNRIPIVYRPSGWKGRRVKLITTLNPGDALPPTERIAAPRLRELDAEANDPLYEVNRRSREYVCWLQRSLNRLISAGLVVDGISGSRTRAAVRSFQRRAGIGVDGVVGPVTERALVQAGAGTPPGGSTIPPVTPGSFRPVAVESPGGGRVRDKRDPASADLVTVRGTGGRSIRLHRLAAQAWRAMVGAARADGINAPLLLPTSGYRSSAHQRRLWERALRNYGSAREARKWVAPPGSSAHQSGRAVDFYLGGRNSSRNVANLRRTRAYQWLVRNAERFGFYPYPREPWHWEYNPPAATRESSDAEFELDLEMGC